MSLTTQFRQLLQKSEILVLPGIYDCLSAKIAQKIGFEAVFTSGYGISAATLGMPDYGFVTATEMLNSVGKIAESVNIPVIADMDTSSMFARKEKPLPVAVLKPEPTKNTRSPEDAGIHLGEGYY